MTRTDPVTLWKRYRDQLIAEPTLGFRLDVSRMDFPGLTAPMAERLQRAFRSMDDLEAGAIANPDEGRMVGHYWLRAPGRAPDGEIRRAVEGNREELRSFAAGVHSGSLASASGGRFRHLLVIGIGGSALGPQLLADALRGPADPMHPWFLDNTDPDGFDRTLGAIEAAPGGLRETLAVVISKSGGTPETRNGMFEARARYEALGLAFASQAVAVTGTGSELDRRAASEGWLARFPMWDWVGGRTSITSAVGLLPAALLGFDVDAFLAGAAEMDEVTRRKDAAKNPAAMLALMWHHAGDGRGSRDMVVLPYKDRFALLSRYLQQLVMESLGKERDLHGEIVHQGIAVYGNKGSTDQHAYVQQLRDGLPNFFVTFLQVLRDRAGESLEVEPGVTSGDYLHGFLLGTRRALHENGRPSLTITIERGDARDLGRLIALFERAVGLYAALVGINAYHQPGVEAGKKAAAAVLDLQRRVLASMEPGQPRTAEEIAAGIGGAEEVETVLHLLERLAANPGRGIAREDGADPWSARFTRIG